MAKTLVYASHSYAYSYTKIYAILVSSKCGVFQVAMHFKLNVNCITLKLKSNTKTLHIPKVYQNLKVILVKCN